MRRRCVRLVLRACQCCARCRRTSVTAHVARCRTTTCPAPVHRFAQAHALRFPEAAHKQKLRRKPLGLAGAVVVHMHDSLAFVLHKMVHEKVHRVFVVNKDKHPVGVISAHDLLRELVVKFEIPTELKSSLYSRARFRPPTGSPQREAREALEERRVAARSAGAEDDERKQ